MSKKYCIFDENKTCDECRKCDMCDLDPEKECNNCGKCMEMEGYDMRAVKIDEIIEDDIEDTESFQVEDDTQCVENDTHYQLDAENCSGGEDVFDSAEIKYIDDVDGLSELLKDKDVFTKLMHEEYPGLIKINKEKNS